MNLQLRRCLKDGFNLLRLKASNWTNKSNLVDFFSQTRVMSSGDAASSRPQNRLGQEKSPYLLQHAHNPVDWYPWGKEALEKAKKENKPIFLSVGYSTCHWCHVMEKESFENEEIGRLMSEKFVCIKVDREERPDVDRVYMTFIQATSGHGGWPMSVWLTPDLKPIFGGTYFPPNDRYYQQPGFKTLLNSIARKWETGKDELGERGTVILDALMQHTAVKPTDAALPGNEAVKKCYNMLASSFDEQKGGFGKAPKFPQPVNFNFMFRVHASQPLSNEGKRALDMSLQTLHMMARGGMYDHIADGFHRYSTDDDWHVPHFEKMLYDQGQLAVSYVDAYQLSKDEKFSAVARRIFEYVNRDLSDKSGGFYSAEDADSLPKVDSKEKKEGAFCVWTHEEIQDLLGGPVEGHPEVKMADLVSHYYWVKPNGNVDPYKDPHDELKKKKVPTATLR